MAAVVARVAETPRKTSSTYRRSRSTVHSRPRRRVRSRTQNIVRAALLAIGLAFLFIYASLYANLTETSFNRSDLASMCRLQRIENEQLKIELIQRSSPNAVVAAAQKSGMVPATQYDYLDEPQRVASAAKGEDRVQY